MTLEQIQALSNDELRVRVAQAAGWQMLDVPVNPLPYWNDQRGVFVGGGTHQPLPNYPADLNACHEFERMLTCDQAWLYNRQLSCLLGTAAGIGSGVVEEWSWHASARARCEAFLAVMQAGMRGE